MAKTGFFYNSAICIACGACQVACQNEKGLPSGEFFRRVVLRTLQDGRTVPFSGGCNHCARPACAAACPTGAMYRSETLGVVLHDSGLCIGCASCVWNCPYGAVSLSASAGVAQKCDSCLGRRMRGEQPACAAACPVGALRWSGPPVEDAGWQQLRAPFLPDPGRTDPSTMTRFAAGKGDESRG